MSYISFSYISETWQASFLKAILKTEGKEDVVIFERGSTGIVGTEYKSPY